jgi:hypothetical protein
MADDTSAALIAQLDVKFDQLASNMKKAMQVFDDGGKAIEKRQEELKKNLSDWTMNFTGLNTIKNLLLSISAIEIGKGLVNIVSGAIDSAAALKIVAQQAGITTTQLQELEFAAIKTGSTSQSMDDALIKLNKDLGDLATGNATKTRKLFDQLGITEMVRSGDIRTAAQLFDALSNKVQHMGSTAQQAATLMRSGLGTDLLPLMQQGAAGIAALSAEAEHLGVVLDQNTIENADKAKTEFAVLFDVLEKQGTAALGNIIPQLTSIAEQIVNNIPSMVAWVEHWSAWFGLLKEDRVSQLTFEVNDLTAKIDAASQSTNIFVFLWQAWFRLFEGKNPFAGPTAILNEMKTQLEGAARALQAAQAIQAMTSNFPAAQAAKVPVAPTKADLAAADKARALALKQQEALATTAETAAKANEAMVASADAANTEMLKGSTDYYAAVQKQIDDDYAAKVAVAEAEAVKQKDTLDKLGTNWKGYAEAVDNINKAMYAKIDGYADEQAAKLFAASGSQVIQNAAIASAALLKSYQDQTAALGLTAGAQARLNFMRDQENAMIAKGLPAEAAHVKDIEDEAAAIAKAADAADAAQRRMADIIQTSDELRSGLEDIAGAAVNGFGSMKQAAAQFLDTLAQMIIKLYIAKPLIESIFGTTGTAGLLGSVFGAASGAGVIGGSLPFADGGIMTNRGRASLRSYAGGGVANSPQLAVFGEGAGPEAFIPLKGGAVPVTIKMPNMPAGAASNAPTIIQQFDLSGAVLTDEIMNQARQAGTQSATAQIVAFNSRVLPGRVKQLVTDPHRGY